MLRPLQLPADAPELAKQRAAEYALGLVDVALMLNVSKQSAYTWAREGKATKSGLRTVILSLRPPADHKVEPLRFRIEDVEVFARDHELPCDVERLPLDLQRRLSVGAYDPRRSEPATIAEVEWIAEKRAAEQLGIGRTTLRNHRIEGRLNPALTIDGSRYSQLDIHRVLDGTLELYLGAS